MLFNKIRASTKYVISKASWVRIDQMALRRLARRLDPGEIKKKPHFEAPEIRDKEKRLNFIAALDTINFGSGYSYLWKNKVNNSSYKTVAAALKKETLRGVDFGAEYFLNTDTASLAHVFSVHQDFGLLPYFEMCWREIGRLLAEKFQGEFKNLLAASDGRAEKLVANLTENLNGFADQCYYKGKTVYFYKKAQIMAADIYLGFQGMGWGKFADIDKLTMFADHLVPHVLRTEGVLLYHKKLSQKIKAIINLAYGSGEEVEIRAAAVEAVERIKNIINKDLAGRKKVLSIELGWYLWNLGQDKKYKSLPRHRTKCIYY